MADEEAGIGEDGEGSGGKGKLLLIIGVVVVLLIAGGLAFFLLSGGDESAEVAEDATEVVEEEGEKVAAYHAVPKPKEPGMVVILPPGTPFKQAQMSFRIFTYSPALIDYLVANDPKVRHHILNAVQLQDGKLFLDRAGREKLQAAIKDALVEMLNSSKVPEEQQLADKVDNVYFTTFILQ